MYLRNLQDNKTYSQIKINPFHVFVKLIYRFM